MKEKSQSLSTAQIIHPRSGHLVEGYPIIIKNKEGRDSLWMLRIGNHIQEIEANNLLFMYFLSEKSVESRLFKAKAKSITTSEWVTVSLLCQRRNHAKFLLAYQVGLHSRKFINRQFNLYNT
ncbi:hypothetical protein [Elizabethkingia anophelis]|uniref:hypothetical protein n=1 Tax=Elizabethkingia anophelis TaxID=1117645 RepID=UPI001367F54B|nr:hypothetical protein [Elizabethkingia anophelis]MYY44005.1 hypothetical protein [Elizabethkingia anophelis]